MSARPGRDKRGLLVITALWPTPDAPSAGTFVEQRLRGIAARVVRPHSYRGPMPIRYLKLGWDALTVRGRFYGVEAHVLFPAGLIALVSARMRRLPLVVYAHGSDVAHTARKNFVYSALARFVARNADVVVANSETTAGFIRALGRDPVVIPPGVDLTRFTPSHRPPAKRVLYLGGNRHEKGYDRALGLADTLAGPRIAEVHPEDVPALIAEHDVVLVPSRREGFGLVAAEAIASGRWVVASNVGGLRDIVIEGVNGYLVDGEEFRRAVDQVPDYDPTSVAATAQPLSLDNHQARMASVWNSLTPDEQARE